MNKPFKKISDFVIKKSSVTILGVCFLLSPVDADASSTINDEWMSAEDVSYREDTITTTSTSDKIEFELKSVQDKWMVILDEISQYPDNWDAEGAKAIEKDTIDNCIKTLNATSTYHSYLNDIFPTELGTLCIQWYNSSTEALVNAEISPDRIAFYADRPNQDLIESKPEMFHKDSIDKLSNALALLS